MDEYKRHLRVWKILYHLVHPWLCRKFNLTHEDLHVEGPVLLIPNHVCAWDPLLVAMSLKDKHVYYVASEHLFRLGFVTKLIHYLVAPIPRRKASLGTDTVKSVLRQLRAGHSVCIFGEGAQCWDGRTAAVFPGTGKLAKSTGATLVTFKLEGGYLSLPRWGKGVRRGKMHIHPVNIYPPEVLKTMSAAEVDAALARDLYEDAWQRQRQEPVAFKGKRRAEGLERAMYLCPGCKRIGTLQSRGDHIFCSCGLDLEYTETGFFRPDKPFATIADWEDWQKAALHARDFLHGDCLFSDGEVLLSRVGADHSEEDLGRGELRQYEDRLCCGAYSFPLAEIRSMSMVLTHLLLFTYQDAYWQIRSDTGANLRKYSEIWEER
ncbi:MAG: 1-acyl-sn-glycerol-3-phosphate acyltransferase [Oscillospiraceae bacterium]|nr:1-acyl-sn-glycerol-3-phosphate acyltransferase [Oscillospiraceae bacterium]